MYGDSDVIRRRAAAVRDQGADVRALAEELLARVEGLGWRGRAAEAMSARVTERATHLRSVADRHVAAADALADHAVAVDAAHEEIERVQARVRALVDDARSRIEAAPDDPDPDDEALLAFEAPPPGHRAWLEVDVPGLER